MLEIDSQIDERSHPASNQAGTEGGTANTARSNSGLIDLVDAYARPHDLQSTGWLLRLQLERPRRSIRCLAERTRLVKRLLDIAISILLLALLAPVMALVALAVRCTSPGPVIFHQLRTGLNQRGTRRDRRHVEDQSNLTIADRRKVNSNRRASGAFGKPFVLYKFRTMRTDAERNGAQFAVKGDARVTPIGRFLRRSRLDELPQLWNVLRGEMTLVGPRPERPEFIEKLSEEIPDYLQRLGLKPGLTGLAQVINGYDNDLDGFRRKVALDLLYLQNCCLLNDLKILLRTVAVVFTGKGAL